MDHIRRQDDGRPYSHSAYPHLGAPGGPCDSFDQPSVRRIWLQFASRLGKTFFGQCAALKKADSDPGPMIFASSIQRTAMEVIGRTYGMMEMSPRIAPQLRPKHRRKQDRIDFDACRMNVAWSKSVSTLGDREGEFGHGNEIDKFEQASTSKEGEPLKLFLERFKNRPHHKIILESTPAERCRSRIEKGRLSSTNCRFYIPCPHCGEYQVIGFDNIQWEHLSNGHSEVDLARRTANYKCQKCQGIIEDHHRPVMLRAGVWCPEGCTVKPEQARKAAEQWATEDAYDLWKGWRNADWIEGTPLRDGPDAGYQLSSFYAMALTWGDIAAQFVSSKDNPQDLRNFVNSWKAETWEKDKRQTTWEELGKRIICRDNRRGIVPKWASLLTMGIDRQSAGGERFPWVIDAWGPNDQVATIDYGECVTFKEIEARLRADYPHADCGPPVKIVFALFDSGFKPSGVYEFCRDVIKAGIQCWPSKGSNTQLTSDFHRTILDAKTSMPGMTLTVVDTMRTQLWVESQIVNDDTPYSIFNASSVDHMDFLMQLLNDMEVEELDKSNNPRMAWERRSENIPNDFRDCRRYAYIAKLIATRGAAVPARSIIDPFKPKQPAEPSRIRTLNIRR